MTAFLFDLDGTLCHTEPLHFRALQQILREIGHDLDPNAFARHCIGETTASGVRRLVPNIDEAACADTVSRTEARFREFLSDLKPLDGLMQLLARLAEMAALTALVTNAPREDVDLMLNALCLDDRFDAIVIAGELAKPKPDPLPYLEALQRLGIGAHEAVAFEDSLAGITSSTKAGIYTVGVETSLTGPELVRAGADMTVRDFTDHRLSTLSHTVVACSR